MDLNQLSRSVTVRFVSVIVLIFGLMIPLAFVNVVISDREGYFREAVADISLSWAGEQVLVGPVLAIPYISQTSDPLGREKRSRALVMPANLDVQFSSSHEERARGIFAIPVGVATATITGHFDPVDNETLAARFGEIHPEQASLVLGIADSRGVRDAKLNWNGRSIDVTGSTGLRMVSDGIAGADATLAEGGRFEITLSVRYTDRIGISMVGDQSSLQISSDWPHPSFDGRSLPEGREITPDGFTANWTSNLLARGFGSIVDEEDWSINNQPEQYSAGGFRRVRSYAENDSVGYSVYQPDTIYTLVSRALKYGIMFIVLTLVSVLCIELVASTRFHIVQYGVVGIGLLLFFLTLLSLSEHLAFGLSYLIAAILLSTMITTYAWFIAKQPRATAVIAGILLLLYAALYTILQLTEYSLLVGTILLLVLLGALMVATRSLNRSDQLAEATAGDTNTGAAVSEN